MGFYVDLITALKASLEEDYQGIMHRMSLAADVHPSTLKRLLEGEHHKWLNMISRVADHAQIKVVRQDHKQSAPPSFPPEASTPLGREISELVLALERLEAPKEEIRNAIYALIEVQKEREKAPSLPKSQVS